MPAAGWYPDPEGVRGRYRYWDGRGWSEITTTDPRTPPSGFGPPSAGAGGPVGISPPPRRRRTGLLVAGIVLVLAIAGVVGYAVFGPNRTTDADSYPTSTISSYDDGKTGTASPSPTDSASPSTSPGPTSAGPGTARAVACDLASPDQEPAPAQDGRVHGGPLSFTALPSPWTGPEATSRVPYSRDSQVQVLRLPEKLPWQASAQVGITTFAPFPGGSAATQEMLECVMTSDFYTSVDVRLAANTVRTLTVSGHPATIRDAKLTFSHPDLTTKGSLLRFVVVESDPVTYFFSAIPMERTDLVTTIDNTSGSLRVD